MKRLLIAFSLLTPGVTFAQTPPPHSYESEALGAEVMDCVGMKITWKARALESAAQVETLKARVKTLEDQAAATKPAEK